MVVPLQISKYISPFSSISLFSIPRNQRYVYVNDDPDIRSDPLIDSIENLMTFIDKATNKEKPSDDWDDIRPVKVHNNQQFLPKSTC